MRSALAASAVLALAGSSYGFVVAQFAIQPDQSIAPSSGSFYNLYSGYYTVPGTNLVTGNRLAWKDYAVARPRIEANSWLAADRWGGGGAYFGTLSGPGANPTAPEWQSTSGNELGGGARIYGGGNDVDTNNISGLDGGSAGYTWGAGDAANFLAPSAVSPVNGASVDSIFFGQFVLSDPQATLVGGDLLVTLAGDFDGNIFLPLDGSPAHDGTARGTLPFQIEYEREGNLVRGFVVLIPTPGATALLGVAGFAGLRRRRR